MNQQIKVPIFGIMLAVSTALGCIAYEKIVKTQSFLTVGLLAMLAYLPFCLGAPAFQTNFKPEPVNKWWIVLYLASGCTGPLWYWLTRTKTVLVGAIFEVKYIAVLVLFSILIGEKGVTAYTVLGALLAMASIYFISK